MTTRLVLLIVVALVTSACSFDVPRGNATDVSSDADIEGADARDEYDDADGDHLSGDDGDVDGEPIDPGQEERAGHWSMYEDQNVPTCRNGKDEDEDGLSDCSDLDCLADPLCCVDSPESGIEGEFRHCREGLEACGWTRFLSPDDGDAVVLFDGELHLGGDGVGEVGLYSEPLTGLVGEPFLTFVASLTDPRCATGSCPQVLGVALSTQGTYSTSTGVQPTVGIVLDGEARRIYFFNRGRIEHYEELGDDDALTRPLLYGFQLHTDGSVSFWDRHRPDEVDPIGRPLAGVIYESLPAPEQALRSISVAAFGRLSGTDTAQIASIHLRRRACDVPNGWSRASSFPVFTPHGDIVAARNPTVEDVDGELVMIFEREHGLSLATSSDGGFSWEQGGTILNQTPSTQYGLVSTRSPAMLAWVPPGSTQTLYHLWYVGQAETGSETPEGVNPTAILLAHSEDGVTWREADEPIMVEATDAHPWLSEVAAPTVVEDHLNGGLRMWFVGSSRFGMETRILTAHSNDGKDWRVEELPIDVRVTDGEPIALPFERDGRSEPVVISRQGVFSMWYAGSNGARSSIGYAVSGNGIQWERFGQVLSSASNWESQRLGGPAIVSRPSTTETTENLHLFYHGGTPERERIGLATRELPMEDYLPQPSEFPDGP